VNDTAQTDIDQAGSHGSPAQSHAPVAPQGAVSGPQKEYAPVRNEPIVRPSIPEVAIAPEIKEHGVEQSPDPHTPTVSPPAKQAGVEVAKEATPPPVSPSGKVQLPMTVEQAQQLKKTKSWKDSIFWLAELVIEQGKKPEYLHDNKKQ
jgi:hypothetical protein